MCGPSQALCARALGEQFPYSCLQETMCPLKNLGWREVLAGMWAVTYNAETHFKAAPI